MRKVLIIEDDKDIASMERDYLELADFTVETEYDGTSGLERALQGGFSLILLDIMLPGMDGFSVCRELRKKMNIPILLVTARHDDIDKIRGLGLGANDYIEKPFSPSVLVARIKSQIANYERLASPEKTEPELHIGDITVNTETRRVYVNGREIELKNKEYELLAFLMQNPDTVFSKERLYDEIWGHDSMSDTTTVPVHINRLREKIEADPAEPRYVVTVWGAGYRFQI